MIERVRLGILTAVLGYLLLHFLMVWLYVNPFQQEPYKNFWAQWYCSPFFSQGWNLFVPAPGNNYQLFVEYEANGKKNRSEIFQSLVLEHRSNRLAGKEPLVIAFTNSIHYFEQSTRLRQQLNGPVKDDLYFEILRHTALNHTRNACGCEPANFRLILHVKPLSGEARVYY